MLSRLDGDQILLPGLASAHSHAFQRAMRGHCQRKHSQLDSFWSWRTRMYEIARSMTPASMYRIARFAYAELAMSGVCAVGEFHYLHHQLGGQPYDNRTEMADAVIAAAKSVGIRISLLRVLYERAGHQKPIEPGQERFCDNSVDDALSDIDSLRSRYSSADGVEVGLAIHSIRAVSRESIRAASKYAKDLSLPMHMHLCEQEREISECVSEHGTTPVNLMNDDGVLDENFVAVHATHLHSSEFAVLAHAGSQVCVCRTTERDLGDGHCEADKLAAAGVPLCTGVDSYASSDPFEEVRAIELDQRSLRRARTVVADATTLLTIASENGYSAIGMPGRSSLDKVVLTRQDASLAGLSTERLDDAIVYCASPRAIKEVWVAGDCIVKDGIHREYSQIRREFEETLAAMH